MRKPSDPPLFDYPRWEPVNPEKYTGPPLPANFQDDPPRLDAPPTTAQTQTRLIRSMRMSTQIHIRSA